MPQWPTTSQPSSAQRLGVPIDGDDRQQTTRPKRRQRRTERCRDVVGVLKQVVTEHQVKTAAGDIRRQIVDIGLDAGDVLGAPGRPLPGGPQHVRHTVDDGDVMPSSREPDGVTTIATRQIEYPQPAHRRQWCMRLALSLDVT